MKIWEAAIAVLKETDNPAVMWGDGYLLHEISKRMGWEPNGYQTEKRVLNALTRNPGPLIAKKSFVGRGRAVRIFRLPETLTGG